MTLGSEHGLLAGVEEAVAQMCNGEKAQVWIHPGKWGFGTAGKPEFDIPGEALLEYIIHLKKFENVSIVGFNATNCLMKILSNSTVNTRI